MQTDIFAIAPAVLSVGQVLMYFLLSSSSVNRTARNPATGSWQLYQRKVKQNKTNPLLHLLAKCLPKVSGYIVRFIPEFLPALVQAYINQCMHFNTVLHIEKGKNQWRGQLKELDTDLGCCIQSALRSMNGSVITNAFCTNFLATQNLL